MARERLFLDTSFIVARFYRRDQFHSSAMQLTQRLNTCEELWTTEAILLEVSAVFSSPDQRTVAIDLWDRFQSNVGYRLVAISGSLLEHGMRLYRERPDKSWSLTDCVSFVVMTDQHLKEALTCDHHFVQAGFRLCSWNRDARWRHASSNGPVDRIAGEARADSAVLTSRNQSKNRFNTPPFQKLINAATSKHAMPQV